jgi:hypothetical protein
MIFCRLWCGDDGLPASPSLVRFLDVMNQKLRKSGFGGATTGPLRGQKKLLDFNYNHGFI